MRTRPQGRDRIKGHISIERLVAGVDELADGLCFDTCDCMRVRSYDLVRDWGGFLGIANSSPYTFFIAIVTTTACFVAFRLPRPSSYLFC